MIHHTSALLKRLLLPVLALSVVAFIGSGCSLIDKATKSETARANVGDCIKVNKASDTDADTETIDCASDDAIYKVAKTSDAQISCPSQAYSTYTETLGNSTSAYLCLVPNLKEGKCYKDEPSNIVPIACTDPGATFKITKKVDGQEDENLCAEADNQYMTFPDPKLTYCMQEPPAQ